MLTRKTIFMFSGQGSHYLRMGRALFGANRTFRDSMLELDSAVQRLSGHSVVHELYDGPGTDTVFDRTLLTHPAIFMVEYSLALALIEAGVYPDFTWGASVGAVAAAVIAGFVDVRQALALVVSQANALESHCERGGMLAILDGHALFEQSFLRERCELAGVNFDSHFVVAAPEHQLAQITAELQQRGVTQQRLPVSFAFHSRWIDAAREPFESHLRSVTYRRPRIPMMCCESASVLESLPSRYFWDVARLPMRFAAAAARMEELGPCRYIDVGPSGTLGTFLKYSLPARSASQIYNILSPFGRDVENFAAVTHATAAARGLN